MEKDRTHNDRPDVGNEFLLLFNLSPKRAAMLCPGEKTPFFIFLCQYLCFMSTKMKTIPDTRTTNDPKVTKITQIQAETAWP